MKSKFNEYLEDFLLKCNFDVLNGEGSLETSYGMTYSIESRDDTTIEVLGIGSNPVLVESSMSLIAKQIKDSQLSFIEVEDIDLLDEMEEEYGKLITLRNSNPKERPDVVLSVIKIIRNLKVEDIKKYILNIFDNDPYFTTDMYTRLLVELKI